MVDEPLTIPCEYCENGQISYVLDTHTKYRCNECRRVVQTSTQTCKNHLKAGSYPTLHEGVEVTRACKSCKGTGYKEYNSEFDKNAATGLQKAVDSLQHSISFDRKLVQAVKNFQADNPFSFFRKVVDHLEHYKPKKAIEAFRQAFVPKKVMNEIADTTECDKWVEKNRLSNIIMWTLSFFLQYKTEELTIKEIANASGLTLGRALSDDGREVSHNAFGVRLEKSKLIKALEMMLQLCSTQLSSKVYTEDNGLINVYVDWFYIVKSGKEWDVCKSIGKDQSSKAIKIGVGIEWESKAVVSLIMHGEHLSNDVVSLRDHMMIPDRPGIVYISDMGPSDTNLWDKMKHDNQFFIIQLKKNLNYQVVSTLYKGKAKITLDTPTQNTVTILDEKLISLNAKPDLGVLKYIRFQYNSIREGGKIKTIELISSLPLSAEEIVQSHAFRWVATETEFNVLQHQFGLEKLYVKKPEKVWAILLLVLTGKMIMEFLYRAIHSIHGSTAIVSLQRMQTASFRRGFDKFLDAVLEGKEDPWSLINPCGSSSCCFRNTPGKRLR